MNDPLLDVRDLHVGAGDGVIVDGVSLTVGRGESLALVGESGSGKSMVAKAVAGLLPPGVTARGEVHYAGLDLMTLPGRGMRAVRGSGVSLLLQDPFTMLNPFTRVRTHLDETRRAHGHRGIGRPEIARRLAEVGIDDPRVAGRYPFELSGGMRQRVGLAAALAADPDLLIADEPTTALDSTTQREVLDLIQRTQQARGMGLLLITHDLRVAFSLCERVLVMYAGSILESGRPEDLRAETAHPYTAGLLAAEPPLDRRARTLFAIDGAVPRANDVKGTCGFAARCAWREPACVQGRPPLTPRAPGHLTACRRHLDLSPREPEPGPPPAATATAGVPPALEVRGLAKAYAGVPALTDVALTIPAGTSLAVVGESGSGKTTLIRCLLGLERPDRGEIVVAGTEVFPRAAHAAHRLVQCVFQDPYSSLNPRHTVGFALAEALRRSDGGSVGGLLERVGLPPEYAGRRPHQLSGGERQRVAIARALAVRPRLLACDEPVAALDVSVQAQILKELRKLRADGQSLLFISHDLAVVRQVADHVAVLYQGRIVECGPADRVLDEPEHAYTRRLVDSVPTGERSWLREVSADRSAWPA
ncbi:ABC transporter ATP-binding protein [Spongiactinospora rosea]|uniref:ABC transporter ATP-binding protein n=1 Tax=Spongiactinospora rosea TaxID=2248750 RepID=A0A366LZL5_9ACTN|nr:ABC transporter ATP-binding protein [Spongiactinospora rosea]RBQ19395.1 ABC transporter ATP-binding protein [Spongiactinospora rosea]